MFIISNHKNNKLKMINWRKIKIFSVRIDSLFKRNKVLRGLVRSINRLRVILSLKIIQKCLLRIKRFFRVSKGNKSWNWKMIIGNKLMKLQIIKVHWTILFIHKIQGQKIDQTKIYNHWFIILARRKAIINKIIRMSIVKEFKMLSIRLNSSFKKDQ